jgi:hypothetical protein
VKKKGTLFSRPIGVKRREAARLSIRNSAGSIFANFQYPAKEKRDQFQNKWNRISVRFYFT